MEALVSLVFPTDIGESENRLVNYQRALFGDATTDTPAQPKTIRRNKWRPDPKIDLDTLLWKGIIGVGGFGSVYLVHNPSTKTDFAAKIQSETLEQRTSREKRGQPPSPRAADYDPQQHTPPITPSSEASIASPTKVAALNLLSKRSREIRTYLRYIRSGHPNICALEAFLDFTAVLDDEEKGVPMFASFFEFCDGGDLSQVIKGYGVGYEHHARCVVQNRDIEIMNMGRRWRKVEELPLIELPIRRHPPELFLWHIFSQLMGALAFLHNEGESGEKVDQKGRAMILTMDLGPQNVFLKWPAGKDRKTCYPDVKVGDFGEANFLPPGGNVDVGEEEGLDFVWGDPPEDEAYDVKTDIWCVGAMMHVLGTRGFAPTPPKEDGVKEDGTKKGESREERKERERRQKKNPERVRHLEGIYSETLDKAVRTALHIEREKRPSSGPFSKQLEKSFDRRRQFFFRQLPSWIQDEKFVVKHEFPPDRIRHLVAGGWEEEMKKLVQKQQEEEDIEDREAALMWVEKDRKIRFGIPLEEWELGDDEDNAQWLKELIVEKPELYRELLEEARISVPSPGGSQGGGKKSF
ncbi:hypothetical protein NHQ30_002465 [Ciborinia camelliae]|nr:hypothetical protein NHQ30_002465 [Ciborinia camelliae]